MSQQPRTSRPATIQELAERAREDQWDDRTNLKHYLRAAEKYRKEGKELAKQGDVETAFVYLARAATLVLDKLPTHPEYNNLLSAEQQRNLTLNGKDIVDQLSDLKKEVVERYDAWQRRHPNGTPAEPKPRRVEDRNAQPDTNHIAQRRQQEEAEASVRDQLQRSAEEARMWKEQREEAENRMRDLTLASRHAEQRRQEDQDAMMRRQRAADEQARAIRQNMAPAIVTAVPYTFATPSPSPLRSHPPFAYPTPSTARASVYNSSDPPPITTMSPPPSDARQRVAYPQLMSPHQQRQGYMPSVGSMFRPPDGSLYDFGQLPPMSAPVLFKEAQQQHRPEWPRPPPIAEMSQPPRHPVPASSVTYPSYPAPTRPAPPLPPPPPHPASAPPTQASIPTTQSTGKKELKQVTLPRECLPRFIAIAKGNTTKNLETCGLLLGVDRGHKYVVTTLLVPKQHATSDTCTMDEEELVLQFTEERGLITLGWIHTHPSQSCFMSSVDLHTHSGFQRMLPESFAVVCAPKSTPNFGIFRLTDPPGLQVILDCHAKEAFHPHPDIPIYTDADKGHVHMKSGQLEIVDLR